jgi:hypothetical protein
MPLGLLSAHIFTLLGNLDHEVLAWASDLRFLCILSEGL